MKNPDTTTINLDDIEKLNPPRKRCVKCDRMIDPEEDYNLRCVRLRGDLCIHCVVKLCGSGVNKWADSTGACQFLRTS
jgi:hypothetical protein